MSNSAAVLKLASGPTHRFINQLIELADADNLAIGDRLEVEAADGGVFSGELIALDEDNLGVIRWVEDGETKTYTIGEDDYPDVVMSPAISKLWESQQKEAIPDGVAWSDDAVPAALHQRLQGHFEALLAAEPADYHPGSGETVRDLVHPSLYCFVEGKSALRPGAQRPQAPKDAEFDDWGRPYEGSKYQWLPTPFQVDEAGQVAIDGYINNLDRSKYATLYDDLALLFAAALPLFESVRGYAASLKLLVERDDDREADLPNLAGFVTRMGAPVPLSLKGAELQVITKIVEYQLDAAADFEGVWHVEGMSHEHILSTGVYVLDRDEALDGGEIRFRRPYTRDEAGQLFWNVPQCRKSQVDELVGTGVIPIGSLATPKGRLLVFPNAHIHKLAKMSVAPGATRARRRVMVFWLVNPAHSIVSTREVAPQQETVSLAEARKQRLALMEERRLHKQSHNVRTVSLCEH